MAGETAAGGGRIDGWHIISLLIAAPQNWIASRGLWSVRIWLMSPTPLLSSDSSLLSGPGLGFLSFPLTAIPPPLYPLPPPRCLYLDSVSGEEATKGLLTRSIRPPLFLPRSRTPVLFWPLSVFLYLFPQFLLKCCIKVKENLTSNVSLLLKTTKWVSKLFLFDNQICQFLSGMFIISWLELQKQQLKEGVNHSFQSGFVQSFTKWFWGEMELCYDLMLWFTHTSSALLSNISHEVDAKWLTLKYCFL